MFFFSINDERLKFDLYKKKYLGNSNYFFSKEVGLLFFSKPDNEVVHFTSEFVDIFKTKNILKNSLNLGFFDNGIDLDKKSIVAIGDSFTRGTGSEDNIKYGWVSLIEKNKKLQCYKFRKSRIRNKSTILCLQKIRKSYSS